MRQLKPEANCAFYNHVRICNYIPEYKDYVLGYADGQDDKKYCASIPYISRASDDYYYSYGYSDGFHERRIQSQRDIAIHKKLKTSGRGCGE